MQVWQRGTISVPLMLEVQVGFVPVSGLTPTVEVYRNSDDFYADWSGNSFVASGGLKLGSMTAVPTQDGLYRREFAPINFGEAGQTRIYYARFRATIPSGYVAGNTTLTEDRNIVSSEIHYFEELGPSGCTALRASFT